MKQVLSIIRNQFSKSVQPSIPLGRWNIVYCVDKLNAKVDLANEDHCGPCGDYKKTICKNMDYKNVLIK